MIRFGIFRKPKVKKKKKLGSFGSLSHFEGLKIPKVESHTVQRTGFHLA